MISVGIDVSKEKSTVCVLKPYGKIVCSPFEIQHVEKDLEGFHSLLEKLDGEIRIVMEATGIYHLPVLTFFHNKGYFVSVINPFAMKKYAKDKDKLSDFLERFWHFDLITSMSLENFREEYLVWAKENKYHRSRSKADAVYELASSGIPTLSSSTPSTKVLVQEAISVLRTVDGSLSLILTRIQVLAKSLPEYSTVRKVGYEVMRVLKNHPAPKDDTVYNYILKKESEGKSKKHAKIAGLNKFLRIYYARVIEVYQ